ncbi:TPA: hypothetical protein N0F65_010514 [Lagenidium giganteum]|uniref:Uncharacterized protein n=1 Tax=Lagenidium giganteum TaxID=4803 RepID=A0AAV2ZB41_9STRA|nr:TPA: hypothetical protein N0F65_010514 [Lagenidium giganteum]
MKIQAYHVSSVNGLEVIRVNECDDPHYDGELLGARVACFTTTRYQRRLPDFSVYPRDQPPNTNNPRYVMEFDADEYRKFKMAKTESFRSGRAPTFQVHYLLLRKQDTAEHAIADLINNHLPGREGVEWELYFPGGRANEYTGSDQDDDVRRTFVNVMFWHDVDVTYHDHVSKRRGDLVYPTAHRKGTNYWLNNLMLGWNQAVEDAQNGADDQDGGGDDDDDGNGDIAPDSTQAPDQDDASPSVSLPIAEMNALGLNDSKAEQKSA